jgi:hypothetical protein
MSRTDKTDPYTAKLWHGALRREAWHDHSAGECDLPRTLADDLAAGSSTRCSWELFYDGTRICCCEGCRAQTWERAARKGERNRARVRLGEALKAFRAGGDWAD